MIDQFKVDYLQGGWEILLSIKRTFLLFGIIVGIIMSIFTGELNYRSVIIWPILFWIIVYIDDLFHRIPQIRETWFIVLEVILGSIIVFKNISFEKYFLYESWVIYAIFCQYWSIFMWLNWLKSVFAFWGVTFIYIILMTQLYSDVTSTFYFSFAFASIMFPLSWFFISEKVKELFIFMKTNEDLIHTVRTILQLFPEGVIIRSIDPVTRQTISRFANDVAWKIILNEAEEEETGKTIVKVIKTEENEQNSPVNRVASLDEFLCHQELHIMERGDFKHYIKAMIEINRSSHNREEIFGKDDETFEESSNYFNVKSIKVMWENNKESFMHAFINTTQIRKLEEERAKSKWHHLILASVSHEFRTPINAFVNALNLIDFLIKEMITNLLPWKTCK